MALSLTAAKAAILWNSPSAAAKSFQAWTSPFLECRLVTKKSVKVDCQDAYGPIHPEARQAVPRAEIPADIPLDLGTQLQVQTPDGHAMTVTVVEVTETEVTLDANHPLAGKDLTFDIEIVSING